MLLSSLQPSDAPGSAPLRDAKRQRTADDASVCAGADDDEELECVGEVTWAERDAVLRVAAVPLEDSPMPPGPKVTPPISPDEDEIAFVGARTAEERNAEGFANAIDLDALGNSPLPPAPPPAAKQRRTVKPEPKLEELERLMDDIRQAPPDPGGAAAAAAKPQLHRGGAAAAASVKSQLNSEQQRAVSLAMAGENIFLTGGAGTGKSFTLNQIIEALRQHHGDDAVAITATTGIAATHIGGTTLHSWSGIGVGKGTADELFRKMSKHAATRWHQCLCLVIDEVSMLDGSLFDKLDAIGRRLLDKTRCFGGVQLVLCGDFFQLPPVGLLRDKLSFLFEANAWPLAAKNVVLLRTVFRQTDQSFVDLLNEMRQAELSPFSVARLQHAVANPPALAVVPTKLYPHNERAEEENSTRLHALEGKPRVWRAIDTGSMPWLLKDLLVPQALVLKPGAQVMLLKNLDTGAKLVNGSRGVVVGFEPDPSAAAAMQRDLETHRRLEALREALRQAVPAPAAGAISGAISSLERNLPMTASVFAAVSAVAAAQREKRSGVAAASEAAGAAGAAGAAAAEPAEVAEAAEAALASLPLSTGVPTEADSCSSSMSDDACYPSMPAPPTSNQTETSSSGLAASSAASVAAALRQFDFSSQFGEPEAAECSSTPSSSCDPSSAEIDAAITAAAARAACTTANGAGASDATLADATSAAAASEVASMAQLPMYPVVDFEVGTLARPQKLRMLVTPASWELEQSGKKVARRDQVPLKLAWAISIHKSQGMTLPAAEVDLAHCFDDGMAYVALSRVVSLQSTRLLSFDPKKVTANARVARFYASIGDTQAAARANCTATSGASSSPGGSQRGSALSQAQRERLEANKAAALAKRKNLAQLAQPPQPPQPLQPTQRTQPTQPPLPVFQWLLPQPQAPQPPPPGMAWSQPWSQSWSQPGPPASPVPYATTLSVPFLQPRQPSTVNGWSGQPTTTTCAPVPQPLPLQPLPTHPLPYAHAPPAPLYERAPGKQVCNFGTKCYRKNPEHFAQYDHPADHPYFIQDTAAWACPAAPQPAPAATI